MGISGYYKRWAASEAGAGLGVGCRVMLSQPG